MLVALIAVAFLAGSIPFGLLIARARGVDIRAYGSGNIGATNVGRVLGRKYFFLCFAFDFAKGFVPTLVAGRVLGALGRMDLAPGLAAQWLGVMLAAVLGHVFCPWLKFKGGKGVATSAGAALAVFPALTIPGAAGLMVFLIALGLWRYVSLAAVLAGTTLPIGVAAWFHLASRGVGPNEPGEVRPVHMLPFLALGVVLAALVVWTHRANLGRLRKGTEPRAGQRVRAMPPQG